MAIAYQNSSEEYQMVLNCFYGGEMSCTGQLYTPMFGLVSTNPENAYTLAYGHTLFDLGYAKDISALVSAMINMALRTQNMDSIINTTAFTDPIGYQDSRLVGQISHSVADASVKGVIAIKDLALGDLVLKIP